VPGWSLPQPLLADPIPRLSPSARSPAGALQDDLDQDWKQNHSAIMPVLSKRLKQGGVFFENHVAALPVCGPSRASLLYGRYPHNTKYYDNCDYDSMQNWAARQNDTVGRWLAKSGYHTAFLGKYGARPNHQTPRRSATDAAA
jgi:arylsulfatase A-like enzyme